MRALVRLALLLYGAGSQRANSLLVAAHPRADTVLVEFPVEFANPTLFRTDRLAGAVLRMGEIGHSRSAAPSDGACIRYRVFFHYALPAPGSNLDCVNMSASCG